jgi:hypothetical protein
LGSDSIFIVSLQGRYQRPEAGINDENEKTIGRRSNPPNSVHSPNHLLFSSLMPALQQIDENRV